MTPYNRVGFCEVHSDFAEADHSEDRHLPKLRKHSLAKAETSVYVLHALVVSTVHDLCQNCW